VIGRFVMKAKTSGVLYLTLRSDIFKYGIPRLKNRSFLNVARALPVIAATSDSFKNGFVSSSLMDVASTRGRLFCCVDIVCLPKMLFCDADKKNRRRVTCGYSNAFSGNVKIYLVFSITYVP
jgi:hypothetical protein